MSNAIYLSTQTLLFISIAFLCYILVKKMFSQRLSDKIRKNIEIINEQYKNALIAKREKSKRLKLKKNKDIFYKINLIIDKTGLKTSKVFWFINPSIIILMCGCTTVMVYLLFEKFFKVISVSLIMALPGFFIPIIILSFIAQKKESQIEKVLGNFLLQLKNNTRIHNDIIEAFRAVQDSCIEPLKSFVKQFLAEINSGVSVERALESFKDKINIDRFKNFLTNLQYCYTYGGNFTELLDNTQKLISEIQCEKKRRIQETRSARIVLFILMTLDIYLYFDFIKAEPEYMNIMRTTFLGQFILNFNFLSMWFLLWLSYKVKRLDY